MQFNKFPTNALLPSWNHMILRPFTITKGAEIMNFRRLSLCMIVKDEEERIGNCLILRKEAEYEYS